MYQIFSTITITSIYPLHFHHVPIHPSLITSSFLSGLCTHQRGHSEHLHGEICDRELLVMVVSHIVALQALIALTGGKEVGRGGGRRDSRQREREKEGEERGRSVCQCAGVCASQSTHHGGDGEELH